MKLKDGIIELPLTGECKINVKHITRCFGFSIISRWHDEYRLCNQRAGIKVTISKEDAIALIANLELHEVPCSIFANASTFMTAKRLQRANQQ
jgi:hypothetical protein